MGTVEGKSRRSAGRCWKQPMICFGARCRKTSVEDITSRAKVAKGTFICIFRIRVR